MHGPIAAVAPGTPVIVIATQGRALTSVLDVSRALHERQAQCILIADGADADLRVPSGLPEWLSPMVAVAPGQVLARRSAIAGGHPVDEPAGLSKVTETF